MAQTIYYHVNNIRFYRSQLRKFHDLGIGKVTENGVTVTERLINTTRKRLSMLDNLSIKKTRRNK